MGLCLEVDENNKVIGLCEFTKVQELNKIHRSSHLLLQNSKGEFMIHKRAPNRYWYPNLYAYSISGTVKNESYIDNINIEMKEELGISIPVKLLFIYKYFDTIDKSFHALFFGITDKNLTPDPNEISELKWFSPEKLKEDIKDNPEKYVPHVIYGLNKYFNEIHNKEKINPYENKLNDDKPLK